jgi:hypothetical protein
MIYPSRPTIFQTIASGYQSIAGTFVCSRREACKLISETANLGIPILGFGAAGLIGGHFAKNNQRILAGCSMSFLLLGTMVAWACALKVHKRMFSQNSMAVRRIFPSPPATIQVTVAPPA